MATALLYRKSYKYCEVCKKQNHDPLLLRQLVQAELAHMLSLAALYTLIQKFRSASAQACSRTMLLLTPAHRHSAIGSNSLGAVASAALMLGWQHLAREADCNGSNTVTVLHW